MTQTKIGNCPLCSTHTTLYEVIPGEWACKDNLNLSCYATLVKVLTKPLPITIKDF